MRIPALLFTALIVPSLCAAKGAGFFSGFRALVEPGGLVMVDEEIYDVGPMDGETKAWRRLDIRLQGAPDDLLTSKRVGGEYKDQYGGVWTVERQNVVFRNKAAVCDGPKTCYFLVPKFGGYKRQNEEDRTGPIVGVYTVAEADAIIAKGEAKSKEHDRNRIAAGRLLPHEIPGTPLFARLVKAIAPYVDAKAVENGALRPHDFPDYEIVGHPGAWRVAFFNDHDRKGPKTPLGVVPGQALEASEFALSDRLRSILDKSNDGVRIMGTDTLGLDHYVVMRAFQDAYAAAAAERSRSKARGLADRIGDLLKR